MKIIGLTGGIGSGKSTVAQILKKYGAYIIDADTLARELLQKNEKVAKEIVNHFGVKILDSDGEIDRRSLAQIVFNNKEELKFLNNITHPEVEKKTLSILLRLKQEGFEGIAVLDVPIPTEYFIKTSDVIWVVDSDFDVRVQRIIQRSGFTIEEAEKRINSQMSQKEYLKIADVVIINNGTIEDIEKQVKKNLINI